jgi:hypothetical protein
LHPIKWLVEFSWNSKGAKIALTLLRFHDLDQAALQGTERTSEAETLQSAKQGENDAL